MNITLLLEMAADAFDDRNALTCAGDSLTYRELFDAAARAGTEVAKEGPEFLCQIGVSSPATAIALFAAASAGVPYVPLNYRLTDPELAGLLERCQPAFLVADAAYFSKHHAQAAHSVLTVDFLAMARNGAAEGGSPPPVDDGVAVQLFTSGTTGRPKAALLRHGNLFSYIVGSVEFGGAEPDEATLVSVPPYHIAGISAVLSSVYAGRRIVQLPNFDPVDWLRVCEEQGVTHAFLVPTMLSRVIEQIDAMETPPALPRLRAVAYGGGRMPLGTIERAMRLFPHADFTNAYGLTETSSTICVLGPDDHRAAISSADPVVRRRLGSVGKPIPGVELQVRDEDGTDLLDPEGVGAIFVRAAQVSGEYSDQGSLLDDAGWFNTRDRGYIDSEGYVFLDGRADDVIVRGGENISPGEIEEVLLAHPDVRDAAVFGIPHEEWGEGVAAAVVAGDPALEVRALQDWVKMHLRSSRVPEQVIFLEQLPYNEMGKVLRRILRANVS